MKCKIGIILLLIIAITSNISMANEQSGDWTDEDTLYASIFWCLLLTDMIQTWQMVIVGNKIETNILMKDKYGTLELFLITVAVGTIHTIITVVLPNPYRRAFQIVSISVESSAVTGNFRLLGAERNN